MLFTFLWGRGMVPPLRGKQNYIYGRSITKISPETKQTKAAEEHQLLAKEAGGGRRQTVGQKVIEPKDPTLFEVFHSQRM
jgi:hypothetical protein